MKSKSTLLFLLVFLVALKPKAQSVNVQDSLALVDFYNSTDGAHWQKNYNWLKKPVYFWYGITVVDNRVTRIKLDGNNLNGSFSSSFKNLENLTYLNLDGNILLVGSIPSELAELHNLQDLSLYGTGLRGSIPPELGNLSNLIALELSDNDLTGTIPAELGNLANLVSLSLRYNQLSGSIPPELGNLTNLQDLNLYTNQLTGSIPHEIGNLTNISDLNLDGNHLSGSIPAELGNLVNAAFIYLSNNELSGSIPPELGNLVNTIVLNLENNHISGNIPAELGNLKSLGSIEMYNNQLSGIIPAELGNLKKIESIRLYNNQLSGSIPAELGNLTKVYDFNLSNNKLTGSIPSSLGNLINLNNSYGNVGGLFLNDNMLTGNIPVELGSIKRLRNINISNNRISGNIPAEFGKLENLDSLKLYGNQLIGSIPAEFGVLKNIKLLDLSSNKLSGSIDTAIDNIWYNMDFNLQYNYYTFDAMEFIAQKFLNVKYDSQAIIPIHQNANALYISAGGTLSNNTYKWFIVGQPDSVVITGDSIFYPSQNGKYYAAVTNSICTQLTLYTDTVEYASVLPVTITNLKASQQSQLIKIDFTSVTETNISSYQIQRSLNANVFTTIGSVTAKNNGVEQQNYTFNDLQPQTGNNYYRIKITDKNGKINYSNTVVINVTNGKTITIIYPNPAKDLLHIQTNENTLFSLANQSGQVLITTNINGNGSLNISRLAAGLYYLKNNNTGEV